MLLDFPGVAGHDHLAEGFKASLALHGFDLCLNLGIVGGRFHVANHTECERQVVSVHHGELLVQEIVLTVRIVDEHIVEGVAALAHGNGLESEAVLHNALVHLFAKEHLLAMDEVDGAVGACVAVSHIVVNAVVEDHAVLENFDY